MFVPIHHIHRARGKSPEVKLKAVATTVAGVIATGVVTNLVQAGGHGAGKAVGLGLALGLGCAALGLGVARAIGRQGKI